MAPNIHNNRKLPPFCIQAFPLFLHEIFLQVNTLNSVHFIWPKIHTQSKTELESEFMNVDLSLQQNLVLSHWESDATVEGTQRNLLLQQEVPQWAYLSYTSISVIRGTPRATIALCTCMVLACSLHAFSSNWRTRNAETFTANHGYEQHSWSSRSHLPVHFSTGGR